MLHFFQMKFVSTIFGSERDRITRRRRNLEVNLHRFEEKVFLLEMELEETKRERQKIIDELRAMIPTRHVSTISSSSADFSFDTQSTSDVNMRYCGHPVRASTPKEKVPSSRKSVKRPTTSYSGYSGAQNEKIEMFRKEEEERVKWLKKQQEQEHKLVHKIEKY